MDQLKNWISSLSFKKKRKKTHSELMRSLDYKSKRADTLWKSFYLALRVIWAFVPLALLVAAGWFTFWLVDGIGSERLTFKGYEFFINTIAVDILVHTVAITTLVMRFLFPKKENSDKTEEEFKLPGES